MVEFLLGLSAMFNVAFIIIWMVGVKINKAHQAELQDGLVAPDSNNDDTPEGLKIAKELSHQALQEGLQEQFEQDFGRQLTKYFENWMYKA